ncbi:MAG: nitrilase-related carbon-nitrogen hydrolase [Acidimicrobiales bacterium]
MRPAARRTTLDVLVAQLAPRTHDVGANVREACRLVSEHPDADLAVFAELYLQSYALKGIEPIDVHAADGPLDALSDCARRHGTALVVGAAIRETAGAPGMANAALCIDEEGNLAAVYRKVHLFDAERRLFSPGDEYVVVTLAGVAVGLLICYDLDFPEAARTVAAAGAELLVTVSANMDPYASDHALYARARAVENRIPHVYVNAVGQEGRLRFCGGSTVADMTGRAVAALSGYQPAVRLVTVPLRPDPADPRPDYLAERRVEVPARVVSPTHRI